MSPANWPARIRNYLARLDAVRFTGRVRLTLDFNKGGISRAVVLKEDVDLRREPQTQESE